MKVKYGDLTIRQLREICDRYPGCCCEVACPLAQIPSACHICDNDVKKILNKEIEVDVL